MAGGSLRVPRDGLRGRGSWVTKAPFSVLTFSAAWSSWQSHGPGLLPRTAFAKPVRKEKPRSYPPVDTASPIERRELKAPMAYQIWFAERDSVRKAVEELDGFEFAGAPLFVTPSTDPGAVNAQGSFRSSTHQEVVEHFEQVGKVVDYEFHEDGRYGEVRFKTADEAWVAKEQLDGTVLYGKRLRVELDCSTHYMNKVLVHGLSKEVMWQELKDYFKQAGEITFSTVHGGKTAIIVYDSNECAVRAAKRLNKSRLRRKMLHVCLPWESTQENTAVRVRGLPADVSVAELKRHFGLCGRVDDVSIMVDLMPPEFCE
mmetsp:Transcript_35041/g.81325  ORF Transcript_35041/g.81325 Transcript_35041/m.81325 type:complete len:315 (+) Transcript_35041:44-988(+)